MKALLARLEFAHNGPFGLCALRKFAHNRPFGLCALVGLVAGLTAAAPAAAQYSLRTGSLGGSLASRAISRPLGGTTGFGASRYSRGASRAPLYSGYPYGYSVWVPDYYDYLNSQSQYSTPYAYPAPYGPSPDASTYFDLPPGAAPGSQQPVIINQYFGAPGPQQTNAPEANNSNTQVPGDPIGSAQNYYLIAYKNHAVYTALAYWVEDKTLHYVTTQNTHNQASLDLIDLALTKSLNQRNDVPFAIAGQ
jgi:hypothetical protein